MLLSPGGRTGDLLFLPLCVLADLPLVLGGMGMYLGLGVEEVFTSFSIQIGAANLCSNPPPQIDYLFHLPHLHLTLGVIKGGLFSKLEMKEAFTFHFILDPSVTKICKGTSADIDSVCS